MIYETIPLPYGGKNNASLTIFSQDTAERLVLKNRPTVLVIPGGGYGAVSIREGECVALKFASIGYNAAVLTYSVHPDALFPQSLCEAALAMAYLKENAEKYRIDAEKIYTCGFSAGGHLALSLGVFWDKPWLAEKVGKENSLLRPTAQILCYPVVVYDPVFSHVKSFERLLGEEPDKETAELVSLEKHVSAAVPPTFLWTTLADATVPCENSMILATQLKKAGVPMEFHLYGWGGHGLSLADRTVETEINAERPPERSQINPHAASWFRVCKEWLEFTVEGIL